MKIAYLCTDFGVPVYGNKGASIHVRELSQALRSLGHDVVILCTRLGGPEPAGFGVPTLEFGLDRRASALHELLRSDAEGGPAVARAVRAAVTASSLPDRALTWLRGFAPDVLYERYALNGTAGLTLAGDLGIPHLLEVNAPLVDEEHAHRGLALAATARALEHEVVIGADHVFAVSSELGRWLRGLGVPPERLTVVANAVDPERFRRANGRRRHVRRQLGLDGRPVVAFVGTLRPWHDPGILVRALGVLRTRGVVPQLLIVGDGPERVRLEELAREDGVESMLVFTGSVSHDDVPGYLAAADVAAATYHPEAGRYFSPLKLFEYQAAGLPVVAAELGEIPHCVRPGETGLLYEPGDVDALADALAALIVDRETAAALGRNGREHVLRHHTWTANARAVAGCAAALMEDRS
jgi:glycosyltransferase involved in cell wall biosynthesis